MDPFVAEILARDNAMWQRIAILDQQLEELKCVLCRKVLSPLTVFSRQTLPHSNGPLVPSAVGMAAPVVVTPQKSNLERLYDATPYVVMPSPLSKDTYPNSRFWEKSVWEAWSKGEKEKGTFRSRARGEGMNSSWMEDASGNRVSLIRQQEILGEARRTWVTMRDFKVNFTVFRHTGAPTLDYFRARMEVLCFELQLCAGHWKADKLWRENFSSWSDQPSSTGEPQDTPQPEQPSKKVSRFSPHRSTF